MTTDVNSSQTNSATKVEFAVEMKCNSCKNKIEKELKSVSGVEVLEIDVNKQKLVVELSARSPTVNQIQTLIESELGLTTVIKGIGDSTAAVSEIQGFDDVIGVVRLTQLFNRNCLVDGVIDGIRNTQNYSLNIHEFGDLSGQSFEKVGDVILPVINNFKTNDTSYPSRASFKSQVSDCDLNSYIGRTLAISQNNRVIGAGIVARASKVGDNSKKICACSGQTLWEERNRKQEDRTSRL